MEDSLWHSQNQRFGQRVIFEVQVLYHEDARDGQPFATHQQNKDYCKST